MRKPLSSSNVVILGTLRNVGDWGLTTIRLLSDAFRAAKSLKFILIESDSRDGSASAINGHLRIMKLGELHRLGALTDTLPLRTQRIAYCRNYYLDLIRGKKFSDVDYFCVADFDNVNRHIDRTGIESCWAMGVNWDVATSNQLGLYYDLWALRTNGWCVGDCLQDYKTMLAYTSPKQAFTSAIRSKYIAIGEDCEPILTTSSFGGLAIYNRCLATEGLRYTGLSEVGEEICEHVSLHSEISRRGGRIYINPRMINRVRWRGLRSAPRYFARWIKSAV